MAQALTSDRPQLSWLCPYWRYKMGRWLTSLSLNDLTWKNRAGHGATTQGCCGDSMNSCVESLHVCMLSHVRLCDSMDCSPPGSSVHGISQARILEWVTISAPGNLPDPGTEPESFALSDGFFTPLPPEKPVEHLAQHYLRVCILWMVVFYYQFSLLAVMCQSP